MSYRGRFAPTPSGPLHLGSLLTALASYLSARANGGTWLLRIDDLDHTRCRSGAIDTILRQLEAHALLWDETPRRQSQHIGAYEAAIADLQQRGQLYGCVCTRAQLAQASLRGIDGAVYAGICRTRAAVGERAALRLRVGAGTLTLEDICQGSLQRQLDHDIGDFVVRRADGQIAYQLACVIDEQAQGVTAVVRGADLIGSSFRQRYLQSLLELPAPAYVHGPVLVDERGAKLSKQNHAAPIAIDAAPENLLRCLQLLGQEPPLELQSLPAVQIVQWATSAWDIRRMPRQAIVVGSDDSPGRCAQIGGPKVITGLVSRP